MLESVWLVLFLVATAGAYLLFVERRDQVLLSVLELAAWGTLAFGATNIESAEQATVHVEPAVSLLCTGMAVFALISLPFTATSTWAQTAEDELALEDLPDDVRRALE